MKNKQNVQQVIDNFSTENEAYYYYNRGFEMGKETAIDEIIKKLSKLGVNYNIISQATQMPVNIVESIVEDY